MSTLVLHSPFTKDYSRKEVEDFPVREYRKNGIEVDSHPIDGRCDDLFNVNMYIPSDELTNIRFTIDGRVWMSLTPMELESHWMPQVMAQGRIAVVGLGLGYYLDKVMANSDVTEIDCYESDGRVVEYFKECFADRPGFDKVTFIVGDAREKIGEAKQSYDFLYLDIYPSAISDEVIQDIGIFGPVAHSLWFWMQEVVYYLALAMGELDLSSHEMFRMLLVYHQREEKSSLREWFDFVGDDYVVEVMEALHEYGLV